MKVSYNELSGLCRRAFQGLDFPDGGHEDAADMVVWLEQHGLGGIAALQAGLDHIQSTPSKTFSRVLDEPGLAVIDVAGSSSLSCGALAGDLVYTKAKRNGMAVVQLQNCYNRKLMLGYLARCARRGMSMLAFWRNSQAPAAVEQVVSMHAGREYPTLLLYRVQDEHRRLAPNHSVTLIASPQFALTQSLHPNPAGTGLLELLEPDDFREQSRKVWNEGIEIDEATWTRLKALADRMLVEESDESRRRGAGEQAD